MVQASSFKHMSDQSNLCGERFSRIYSIACNLQRRAGYIQTVDEGLELFKKVEWIRVILEYNRDHIIENGL